MSHLIALMLGSLLAGLMIGAMLLARPIPRLLLNPPWPGALGLAVGLISAALLPDSWQALALSAALIDGLAWSSNWVLIGLLPLGIGYALLQDQAGWWLAACYAGAAIQAGTLLLKSASVGRISALFWLRLMLVLLALMSGLLNALVPDAASGLVLAMVLGLVVLNADALITAARQGSKPQATELDVAVAAERERIYRNLHDDLGARLLSLVYRAETPEEADFARCLLADLRDSVARTVQMSVSLPELVADLREEMSARLQAVGISSTWPKPMQIPDQPMPPALVPQLRRTVRELVSNVIKHAQAKHCAVEVQLEGNSLKVSISDDGRGMPEQAQLGRGIGNISSRLQSLGGSAQWLGAEPCGTLVRIVLPIR